MIVLVELTAAITILISGETLDIGAQNDDKRLLYLADAGVERISREVRNLAQTGVASLQGATASSVVVGSVLNPENVIFYGSANVTLDASSTDAVDLKDFDRNYANARIVSVKIRARARRAGSGTLTSATLKISYFPDGVSSPAGVTFLSQTMSDINFVEPSQDITSDRTWTWATLTGSNFTLRAQNTGGTRDVTLDTMYLEITYEIDTKTEAWFTGSYQTYPLSLGAGTVQSVSIIEEQGKIHLNTASQTLLNNLLLELGITSGTASTLAANIVTYRGTKWFDSVEELQKVTAMTTTNYNLIKDYLTVYSFINSATRPTGNRAPVNVNTASQQVIKAIFDDLVTTGDLGSTDPASLATNIISTRATAPFTCFLSNNSAVTTDFYDFVMSQTSYLTSTERRRVLDIADPSLLIPVNGFGGFQSSNTTELCYSSSAYKVESVADVGGRKVRVKTVLADQGSNTFMTYSGDTSSTGYRKENFE